MTDGIDSRETTTESRAAARRRNAGPVLIVTLRRFVDHLSHPYHPERHYMRGPGPACRAKEQPVRVAAASGHFETAAARREMA